MKPDSDSRACTASSMRSWHIRPWSLTVVPSNSHRRSTVPAHPFPRSDKRGSGPRNPSNAVNGQWVGGSGVLFACVGRPRTRILGLQPAARAMRQSRLPLIGGLFSWLALRRDAASEGVRKI